MKLTNGEIFAAVKSLEELSKVKMPIKTSYQVAMLMKKITPQQEVIEQMRVDLINKHGKKEGGTISITPNTAEWATFLEEMNVILSQEVDIDFEIVHLPLETDGEAINIEPNILISLDKFIEVK